MARKKLRATSAVPRNRHKERIRLADLIDQHGQAVDFPCHSCFLSSTLCVVMESRGSRCSGCVRHDLSCEKRVYSSEEWSRFRKEEERVKSSLIARDHDISILEEKILHFQRQLGMLQGVLMERLAEHGQLRKRQSQLQRSGQAMLAHDSAIIESGDFSEEATPGPQFDALMRDLVADIDSPPFGHYGGAP